MSVIEYDICDTFDGIYTETSQPLTSVKNEKCAVPESQSLRELDLRFNTFCL